MARKVLGIVGSYRKGGTIDQAVREILAAAAEQGSATETIYLLDRHIEFCRNCRRCTQAAGTEPGACIHRDDMQEIIAAIERADALVVGAPVNAWTINALTQRFFERLVCYTWWPWGSPGPRLRREGRRGKPAALVTSSAMPALLGRWATCSPRLLKKAARIVGARPAATLFIGLAAREPHQILSPAVRRKARRIGLRL